MPYPQGVYVDRDLLIREMKKRGWSQVDLAKNAGLDKASISRACSGRRIAERSYRAILDAFLAEPPPGLDLLVSEPA